MRYLIEATYVPSGSLKFADIYEGEELARANFLIIVKTYPICKVTICQLVDVTEKFKGGQ
jgi:hypothetical protein